jgi:CBS-domain-containing membrane protein
MRILKAIPGPLLAGSAMAIIGALAWAVGMPWLFPSLGPTIAIQAQAPNTAVARPWNVVVGHAIGAIVGFACVWLTGSVHQAPVNLSHQISGARLIAAALAVTLSMAIQHSVDADHPPAQATTLLIVVGALDAGYEGAFIIAIGIMLVALLGEGVRRAKAQA